MVLLETKKFTYARSGKPRKFYGCPEYPNCREIHGAHPNGEPLGVPASKEERTLRQEAHRLAGYIWGEWDSPNCKKAEMYDWLKRNTYSGHISKMLKPELESTIEQLRRKIKSGGIATPELF